MNRILLGTYELEDSSGLRLECDVFIPKVSNLPDISIVFKDELIPSTSKLAKDAKIEDGVDLFLRSIGYQGRLPLRLVDDSQGLLAEVDMEFLPFAEQKGWIDLSKNEEAGVRQSLLSVLDAENTTSPLITRESHNVFLADGRRYLILDFVEVSNVVKKGILENLIRVDAGVLAGHASRKLSDSYEERKDLINKRKDSTPFREDFNEWMGQYLEADANFFGFLATTMSKSELYHLAFGGQFEGVTDNHLVFQLER